MEHRVFRHGHAALIRWDNWDSSFAMVQSHLKNLINLRTCREDSPESHVDYLQFHPKGSSSETSSVAILSGNQLAVFSDLAGLSGESTDLLPEGPGGETWVGKTQTQAEADRRKSPGGPGSMALPGEFPATAAEETRSLRFAWCPWWPFNGWKNGWMWLEKPRTHNCLLTDPAERVINEDGEAVHCDGRCGSNVKLWSFGVCNVKRNPTVMNYRTKGK